jgi:hypothetical protein
MCHTVFYVAGNSDQSKVRNISYMCGAYNLIEKLGIFVLITEAFFFFVLPHFENHWCMSYCEDTCYFNVRDIFNMRRKAQDRDQ